MSPSIDAIVGVIGVLLGFLLSEISARLREAQTIRRQIATTRSMLRYEISHNLERLKQHWVALSPNLKAVEDDSQSLYWAEQLTENPMVPYGREVFTSQLGELSTALSSKEVVATLELYDDLQELDTIHQKLDDLRREQRGYTSGAPLPTAQSAPRLMPSTPFRDQGADLWKIYQQVVLRRLSQKSPV